MNNALSFLPITALEMSHAIFSNATTGEFIRGYRGTSPMGYLYNLYDFSFMPETARLGGPSSTLVTATGEVIEESRPSLMEIPSSVYMEIYDGKCDKTYKSNTIRLQ
jgi:hypothetical protein